MFLSSIASTYFAGFLTSLTPCVYPMIPLSLGYLGSRGQDLNRITVLVFVGGQVVMFGLMGLVAVQLGEVFGFLSENSGVQIGIGILLALFAYYSWKERLPLFLSKIGEKLSNGKPRQGSIGLLGAFIAGLVSTIVASPCSTPVLGGVLVMISTTGSLLRGSFLMTIYGLGVSTIFLILGLGIFKTRQLPKSGKWMKKIHLISVLLLAVSSLYFIGTGVRIL